MKGKIFSKYWSVVFIIMFTIAAGGFFPDKAAAQQVAEQNFDDGTLNSGTGWDGDWTVSATASNCSSDGVLVCSNALRIESDNSNNHTAQRDVALPANSYIELQFDCTEGFGSGDALNVNISGTTLLTIPDGDCGTGKTLDLSIYGNNTVTIQFEVDGGNNDDATIDNIQIRVGLKLNVSPLSFSESAGAGVATGTVTRTDTTSGALTVYLTSDDTTEATVPTSVTIPNGAASATFQIDAVDDLLVDGPQEVNITADDDSPAEDATGYISATVMVTVEDDCEAMPASDGLTSQTFPTALFIASYDWLANFYDFNAAGRDTTDAAGHNNDPDTDNFNKIILADSNLFPMITATINDIEFPNITSRNTDNFNDYLNRSIAVAPNYINTTTEVPCANPACEMKAVGMRSNLQWVFVTDPANHNLRRYQFAKHKGFYTKVDVDEDAFGEDVVDAGVVCDEDQTGIDMTDCSATNKGACCLEQDGRPGCGGSTWNQMVFIGDVTKVLQSTGLEGNIQSQFLAEGIDHVFFMCRKTNSYPEAPDGPTDLLSSTYQDGRGILELFVTVTDEEMAQINTEGFIPITYQAAATDSSSLGVYVSVNGKCLDATCSIRDPGPGTTTNLWRPASDVVYGSADTYWYMYTLQAGDTVDASWDVDATKPGVQLRLSFTAEQHGGLVLSYAAVGFEDRKDRGFGVNLGDDFHFNYTEAQREARWNDIGTFLETVPPESYPGYATFTSGFGEKVGYGFTTNTSFDTAANVRFKNPRDIDVYRDYYDIENGGPTYVFVADTMNSRVQVFMNATGSAGTTGAAFPIRPVRVKGPNDTAGGSTAYKSNELGMRLYSTTSTGDQESIRFGDGRKADWRPYLVNYTSGGTSFINVSTGKGEFFYPHGVAVDQDPDTKDVYLFVADTYNHRIQVFRDHSGVTSQPFYDAGAWGTGAIGTKHFDFRFEAGWGTYPLNSSQPGPYAYRYPKGIDVARFANNSSYLYVVDSKNHRLMKYLITENGAGGFQAISAVAGYGYDGTGYSKTLTLNRGTPLTANNTLNPGFLNPQDVATGYSGFFRYTSIGGAGLKFLDNHMVYVTDHARNDGIDHGSDTNWQNRLNLRVMQFIDGFSDPTLNGSFLRWDTESVTFGDSDYLELGQSIFGGSLGRYNSQGVSTTNYAARPGPPENAGVNNVFTDRPVGIATLAWNTTEPIDMRVIPQTNNGVYPNGAAIPTNTALTAGASSGRYFWFPESHFGSYTSYADEMDGTRIRRVHVFCYDTDGVYVAGSHDTGTAPFNFNACSSAGFMKVVAEDVDFKYSGRTGTQIFRIR